MERLLIIEIRKTIPAIAAIKVTEIKEKTVVYYIVITNTKAAKDITTSVVKTATITAIRSDTFSTQFDVSPSFIPKIETKPPTDPCLSTTCQTDASCSVVGSEPLCTCNSGFVESDDSTCSRVAKMYKVSCIIHNNINDNMH